MERNYRLLAFGILDCEVGLAETANCGGPNTFDIIGRSSVAVCDLIFFGVLIAVPAKPVENILEWVDHEFFICVGM